MNGPEARSAAQIRRALRAEIKRRYEDAKLYPSEAQLDKAEAEALRRTTASCEGKRERETAPVSEGRRAEAGGETCQRSR